MGAVAIGCFRVGDHSLVQARTSVSEVTLLHLQQAGLAQVPHAFTLGLGCDVHRVAVRHDYTCDLFGNRHHLVNAQTPLVAAALAALAALGP